jgi:O-methyltransferase
VRKLVTRPTKWLFRRMGYEIVKGNRILRQQGDLPADFEPAEIEDYLNVSAYTLTGPVRVVSLIRSIRYLVHNHIAGDIVECGVWKGGSMMAVAKTLLRLHDRERRLWLYDTYEGMAQPTEADVSVCGFSAQEDVESDYLRIGLTDVRKAVLGVGYDERRIVFVKGRVEETLPTHAPERIALLRLDTDWYESTRHELVHLFPRLVRGGVLIIDDYGHWEGARKATDEYLRENNVCLLLNRIDFSARIGVKI